MWLLRNIKLFRNWWAIYLFGETRLILRNGLIININNKHDIPIIYEVIGTRCYGSVSGKIVDIGANIGTFTLLSLHEDPVCIVYAYEPQSDNFALLKKNIKENGFQTRAHLVKNAVSGNEGQKKLYLARGGDSGHHSLDRGATNFSEEFEMVKCTTLNKIIDEVGDIDFLKIDVEGEEEMILKSCNQMSKVKKILTEEYYTPMTHKYMVVIAILALFLLPTSIGAISTHNYICSDFANQIGGEASCSSNVLTFTNSGGYATDHVVSPGPVFDLDTPTTWYLSFNASGTGSGRKICESNNGGGGDYCNSSPNSPSFSSGSTVDYPLYTGAETSGPIGLYFRDDGAGSPGFSGTISNICISDTIGGCSGTASTTITGSGTVNRLAKFTASSIIGDSLFSDDGLNTTLTSGNLFLQIGSLIDTLTGGALNFGTTNATSITIGRVWATTTIPTLLVGKQSTSANCNSTASPAVCGSASAGSVAMATGDSTLVVNTTAVTADSQILITEDSSLNSRLGITCNTATNRNYSINARNPGTSFTIKSSNNPNTNKACLSYWIIN